MFSGPVPGEADRQGEEEAGQKGEAGQAEWGKEKREEAGRALRATPMRKRGVGRFWPNDQPFNFFQKILNPDLNLENS